MESLSPLPPPSKGKKPESRGKPQLREATPPQSFEKILFVVPPSVLQHFVSPALSLATSVRVQFEVVYASLLHLRSVPFNKSNQMANSV